MTTRNTPMKKAFFQSGSFRVPIAECFLFILAIDWVITGRIRRKPSSAASGLVQASTSLCRMTANALSDLQNRLMGTFSTGEPSQSAE